MVPCYRERGVRNEVGISGVTYKMVKEKTAMGIPRSLASHISEMVPPTFVMGADEAVPAI
jgi:hypothetical protein